MDGSRGEWIFSSHYISASKCINCGWTFCQMLKEGRASPKCDVYSYAIVLWELVSFQFPFKGLTIFRIMTKVTNGEVYANKTMTVCSSNCHTSCFVFQRPAIPSGCDQSLSRLIKQCWVQDYKVGCVCVCVCVCVLHTWAMYYILDSADVCCNFMCTILYCCRRDHRLKRL